MRKAKPGAALAVALFPTTTGPNRATNRASTARRAATDAPPTDENDAGARDAAVP